MRITTALVQVAMVLMLEPDERHWGYELAKASGVRSGVMYPILRRMMEEGWISDGWENPNEVEGRPPRRYYTVTDKGRAALGALGVQVASDPRFQSVNLGWAT
jgi:PadR family transcriptional regulator PadR